MLELATDVLDEMKKDKERKQFAREYALKGLDAIKMVGGYSALTLAEGKLEVLADATNAVDSYLQGVSPHIDDQSIHNIVLDSLIKNKRGAMVRTDNGVLFDDHAYDQRAPIPETSVGNVAAESYEQSTERVALKFDHSRGKMVPKEQPTPKPE